MPDPDYKALCAELVDATLSDDSHIDCVQIARQARAALAQPEPAPTDEESDAFAIVQMRLDDLAGDQELMIYRWPDGEWSIDHTNPTSSVQLGEVNGVYGSTGRILEDVVFALAAQLSANNTREENLDG
jgi:hypothetical protein